MALRRGRKIAKVAMARTKARGPPLLDDAEGMGLRAVE